MTIMHSNFQQRQRQGVPEYATVAYDIEKPQSTSTKYALCMAPCEDFAPVPCGLMMWILHHACVIL